MLSKLPPNSFVLDYHEIRPDLEPNGGVYSGNQQHRVSFHIRGAPNEMLLNSGVALTGSRQITLNYEAGGNFSSPSPGFARQVCFGDDATTVANRPAAPKWQYGPSMILASRESVNSGALPVHDNQDTVTHLVQNNLRGKNAKREYNRVNKEVTDLVSAGFSRDGNAGLNIRFLDNLAVTRYSRVGPQYFSVPLGMYSDLVNSPSVLPVGLFSAYAVNGWTVEITLPKLDGTDTKSPVDPGAASTGVVGPFDVAPTIENRTTPSSVADGYRDLKIYVPVIRILDPAVMESVLSLYEKRQQVNIGGVSFPMSLRINSLGYRHYNFPLRQAQGDYYFRLPSTERSVRAIGWQVYRTNQKYSDVTNDQSGFSVTGALLPVYDSLASDVVLTRLFTRIGSRKIHEPVEDRDENTKNVPNFLSLNDRRSGALLSPFPYWEESARHMDNQSDKRHNSEWGHVAQSRLRPANDQYGVLSLENLDHREMDYSGSFQASGLDLTNIGGVDMEMRFTELLSEDTATGVFTQSPGPPDNTYHIAFVLVHDQVHEVSPSGIIDITSAVL